MTRDEVITELLNRYPKMNLRTTEEFDGGRGGIWVASTEDGQCDADGLELFNYYAEDYQEKYYIFGIRKPLHELLESMGWYGEWYDCGTMMIRKA